MSSYERPTFASGYTFCDAPVGDRDAPFSILGAPMDWATSNRAGAREGPFAIRRASRLLIDGQHPAFGVDPLSVGVSDLGDVEVLIGDIAESHRRIEEAASDLNHVCALGGDHSIALPLLRAAAKKHGPLGMVHFDAHADTWPENFGQEFAHGTPFFHALEEGLIDPGRIIMIGIRAPMDSGLLQSSVLDRGITVLSAEDAHLAGPQAVAEKIANVAGAGATYLTFDVDALDPAFTPGTGTPEMGGLHSWQVRAIMHRLGAINFIGMDVVEVSPPFDQGEITALAAATIVWDYLGLHATKREASS